jgi:uncharacterized protein
LTHLKTNRWIDELTARRVPAMFVGVFVFAMCWFPSLRIQTDRALLALFAPDDPAALAYRQSIDQLGNLPVIMLVYRDPDLASARGMNRNAQLTAKVESVAGVRGVLSPSILESVVTRLRPTGPRPALMDRSNVVSRGFFQVFSGYTHSKDRQYAAVAAILDPEKMRESVRSIRQLAEQWNQNLDGALSEIQVVGEPVLLDDAFDLIERDGQRLALLVVALLGFVLLVTLRDLRVVAVSVLVILWSVVVTRAIMVTMGIPLSLVSSILTSIVAIIASTSALHWGVAAARYRRRGHSSIEAAAKSLQELFSPILWTCITTAAGFLSLAVSRIVPVQHFGVMIAVATTSVLVSLLLIGPAIMALPWGDLQTRAFRDRKPSRLQRVFQTFSRRLASLSIDWRWALLVVMSIVTVVTGYWMSGSTVESNFLNNFRSQSKISKAYRDVENHLGGAGVWDIVLQTPAELDKTFLAQVRAFESQLRKIRIPASDEKGDTIGLSKVLSLADADRVATEAPLMRFVSPSTRLILMRTQIPTFYDALISEPNDQGNRSMRIMLRSEEDLNASDKLALIDAVEKEVNQFSRSHPETKPYVAGYYVLMTGLVRSLIDDQWRSLLVSSIAITLLLALATGSVRDVIAALPTNLAPIVWILGTAAVIQGRLNMGAAMIGACAIGLSIDGSVHYLIAKNRISRRHPNRSLKTIAIVAAGKVGVPVLLATVALILGFGGLTTSEFVPTATFGGLLSITLAIATIANLTLLPALVTALQNRRDDR